MKTRSLAILAITALFAACAGTPGPGDSGYAFNANGLYTGGLDFQVVTLNGTIELTPGPGGAVTGTFSITQPAPISGTLAGTIVGDQLTFEITYGQNALTGCSGGTMKGTVTVSDGGSSLTGTVTADDCGTVIPGDMEFSR